MGKFVVVLLFIVVTTYVFAFVGILVKRVRVGLDLARTSTPYSRVLPEAEARMLIIGDSTAVGTGAQHEENTIAGRFAKAHPDLSIENVSETGLRLQGARAKIEALHQDARYDIMLIQVGGNDILRFTDLTDARADLRAILKVAERTANEVLILHSGNVGLAPFFPWPLGYVFTDRTRVVRQMYIEESRQYAGVHYVDLFTEKDADPFASAHKTYYAPDMLHLSDKGYGVWYEAIHQTMAREGILR